MLKTLTPMRTFVVPGWVHRSLLRNKLNIIDLLDYNKARSVLALDDMAELFYVNDRFKINGCLLSNESFITSMTGLTEANKAELNSSVIPLSGSEEIAQNVITKLSGSNPMNGLPSAGDSYNFISIDSTIFIILHEDFLKKQLTDGKNDYTFEFAKNYLKQCYAMVSIPEVSRLSIFGLYLAYFKAKAKLSFSNH